MCLIRLSMTEENEGEEEEISWSGNTCGGEQAIQLFFSSVSSSPSPSWEIFSLHDNLPLIFVFCPESRRDEDDIHAKVLSISTTKKTIGDFLLFCCLVNHLVGDLLLVDWIRFRWRILSKSNQTNRIRWSNYFQISSRSFQYSSDEDHRWSKEKIWKWTWEISGLFV